MRDLKNTEKIIDAGTDKARVDCPLCHCAHQVTADGKKVDNSKKYHENSGNFEAIIPAVRIKC